MTTNIDINEDDFKSLDKILSQEELIELEIKWVDNLRDQILFANTALTKFQLNLKISRKWKSWNWK